MRSPRSWLAALAILAAGVLVVFACQRTPDEPIVAETKSAGAPESVTLPDVPGDAAAASPVAAPSHQHAINAAIILN